MTKTFKQFLAIVLTFIMIVSTIPAAFATDAPVANGTAGEGVTWVLDSDGTLTISGTGEMDTEWYSPPWENYSDLIKNIVVEEGITAVSKTSFAYAENLVTVSLPSTLTYISGWSFYDNYALEEINVAEANTTYKSNDGILFTEDEKNLVAYPTNKACEEYTIPASVTTIGEMAFVDCIAVDKVIIPDTVTTLENFAFAYSRIKEVEIGNGVTKIPYYCFEYTRVERIIVPDSVETISEKAFALASSLHTLIIGSGIKTIDANAFKGTNGLSIIHYKGTQAVWDEISINEENADLNGKSLHFLSADSYKAEIVPTCLDGHTAGYYCDECDVFVTGEVIPAIDEHDWNNSVCGTCGEYCAHYDDNFDENCDECKTEIIIEEVKLDETNTVYIPEAKKAVIVKFTPAETGEYVVLSAIDGDDEIDPYVIICDSNGDRVEDDDDSGDSYNFYCDFEAEAGETYYIRLYAYESNVEYDYTIEKYIEIAHQPTSSEPYVELNWNVEANYQWYTVERDETEITHENGEAYSYDDETATYDFENGWTPILDADNYYSSATIELNKGDKVIVEFEEGGFGFCGFWDWEASYEGDNCGETDGVLTYEFTMDSDGIYTFYAENSVAHKIYASVTDYTVIDGETDTTLQNPEIGTAYACKITLENDYVLTSDLLEYDYAIIHQPTAEEPYVELNDDTDATYQWYSAESAIVEITDENADIVSNEYGESSYDSEKGWSGAFFGRLEGIYDCFDYFTVSLQAGDTITVELTGDYYGKVGLWDYYENNGVTVSVTDSTTYEITVEFDGYYTFFTYKDIDGEDIYVKAYIDGYEYTAIDGAIDAEFVPTNVGFYACEVTFADGTTEMSDVFEIVNLNGWTLENGKWAYYENGTKLTNTWKKDSKGWCYLDADGYMATNKWIKDSQGWCYVGDNGYCVTNTWKKDSKGWCYLDANGRMATNKWIKDSQGWCYVGADGYCVTNKWVKDSKGWVYLDANGRMVTNKWVKDSKGWCYVGADGYAVTNCWKKDSKGWCYLDENGSMTKNEWVKDGGKWYYLDSNGYMVTGTKIIDGKTYKFNSSGVWVS